MSDPGERRRTWLVGLLVALLLSGCTAAPGRSASPTPATTSSPTPSTTTSSGPGPDLHTVADRILHRRAAAVRGDDRQAFLADVAHRDPRFVARQRRLFDNLVQLPLQVFRLRATASIWSASFAARRWRGKAYLPYVSQTMQLRGFDPRPITTLYGVTLARTGGAWKIVSDTDVDSQIAADAHSAPWEVTRIDVRRSPRVLGIFDAGSLGHAATTMQRAEAGVATVTRDVPLRWRPRGCRLRPLAGEGARLHRAAVPGPPGRGLPGPRQQREPHHPGSHTGADQPALLPAGSRAGGSIC